MGVGDISKRILLGRKLRSSQGAGQLMPKRIALPAFASDALSSVAYAPDEIFIMLSLAGASAFAMSFEVALAVAVVMVAVIASYRQTVRAYPSGGGDYEVATVNLGARAGTTVASALLVDYMLTVAVSVSASAQYAAAAVPAFVDHETLVALAIVGGLVALNLRGVREGSRGFTWPTYAFLVAIIGMCGYGLFRLASGDLPQAASAGVDVAPRPGWEEPLTTIGLIFLLARAFSSGCVALTGVETVSSGVPAFRRPKSRNAATTLAILAMLSVAMMLSVVALANQMRVHIVDPLHLDRLSVGGDAVPGDYDQATVIAQIADALFADFSPAFYGVVLITGIILVLAANTAFQGFPLLGSILARDRYAPRALGSRGDRLAYSNGIVFLGVMAIVLIAAFGAETTQLIQLYIVGVFVSFTLSQLGMIRHWTREIRLSRDPAERRRMHSSRVVNAVGLVCTAVVLVVVLVTKFLSGAWITVLAMLLLFVLMRSIRSHYDRVEEELAAEEDDKILPSRVHAIVLVSKLHKPTLRALAFAQATRPNILEAVTVSTDDAVTDRLLKEWDERNFPMPLKILHSPYRELVRPVVEYATAIRKATPRGVVAVYIPEYVVGRWWEQFLHNQTALRLKGRLLFTPGVMVTSVPYQLHSSEQRRRELRDEYWLAPGTARGQGDGRRDR